ncbi:hypothetical protein F383_25506 [Gossypium arboreum]|uniref:Uncharacterized protein n=1 Tax=Gossypium arboreum TaxID=29729 RepID=A0A0B0N257_GOSAR|nr:hypothetical protein F383_35489 [Gossypium arboreum]KHG18829.1 hypothetical protein F383_25506 [Gossypium arboreum]
MSNGYYKINHQY